MPQVNRQYKDLDFNFLPHPLSGDVSTLNDLEAVSRSIQNLVVTNNYERYFRPEIGTTFSHMLFEPLDRITTDVLSTNIRSVLEAYEPRATIHRVVVTGEEDSHRVWITIMFSVKNISTTAKVSFFLERVR